MFERKEEKERRGEEKKKKEEGRRKRRRSLGMESTYVWNLFGTSLLFGTLVWIFVRKLYQGC